MDTEKAQRYAVTAAAFLLGSCMLGGFLQANVQEWAKANGQDQYLVKYAGPAMNRLAQFGQEPVFVAITWIIIGGSLSLWIDYALRRRGKKMGLILLLLGLGITGTAIWILASPKTEAASKASGKDTKLFATAAQAKEQQKAIPDLLLENPTITQWDSGYFLKFNGKLTRNIKQVSAYLEIEYSPSDRRKTKIFERKNLVKGEQLVGPVASPVSESLTGPYRAGAADTGLPSGDFIIMAAERAKLRFILVDQDGEELLEYGLLLIPRIALHEVDWAVRQNMNPRIQDKVPVPEIKQNNLMMITQTDWTWK